jgi:hypothetical protein
MSFLQSSNSNNSIFLLFPLNHIAMGRNILVIVIVICIVLVWLSRKEHFDTYWNHSIGAQTIYKASKDPIKREASKHIPTTETLAGYTWAAREPNGMQLYDHYYDSVLLDGQMNQSDSTYYERDLESNYLDSKFQTLNRVAGYDANDSNFSHFDAAGMLDPNPLYTVYNGEYITLAQKSF